MLYPLGLYYVKKPKRFVILSSDKSSERNLSCFFDTKKPRRMEHLQSEEPFSSDPYFSVPIRNTIPVRCVLGSSKLLKDRHATNPRRRRKRKKVSRTCGSSLSSLSYRTSGKYGDSALHWEYVPT